MFSGTIEDLAELKIEGGFEDLAALRLEIGGFRKQVVEPVNCLQFLAGNS